MTKSGCEVKEIPNMQLKSVTEGKRSKEEDLYICLLMYKFSGIETR